jgi:hypothetical protein
MTNFLSRSNFFIQVGCITAKIAVPSLEYFRNQFGDRLYGRYGFKDAFNLTYRSGSSKSAGWFDNHYLAIAQGPILLMVENYRTGINLGSYEKNRYIRTGLERAGFRGGWLNNPEIVTLPRPTS